MYKVVLTRRYETALKRVTRRKEFDQRLLEEVICTLSSGFMLDVKYRDHQLSGELSDRRECHIKHNLLLVYRKRDDVLVLLLIDLGSNDEVF